MTMLVFLLVTLSAGCTYVAILEAPGFDRIPLRAVVVVSSKDADWRGPDSIGTGRSQAMWGPTTEIVGSGEPQSGQSGISSRTLYPLPVVVGTPTHKIVTPVKCRDLKPKTFDILPGGKLEPRPEQHLEIYASQLRRQTEASLRQNLPLFLADVAVVEAVPTNAGSYDVAIEPRIRKWPSVGDSVERVQVQYDFTFRKPDGSELVSAMSHGSAEVANRVRGTLTCNQKEYWELERAYVRALVSAQGDAIGSLFFKPHVVEALREYAATRPIK